MAFSVRAAGELRLRLADLLGQDRARRVTAATFHSVCGRLLREHDQLFGRTEQYTIYDQGDVRRVIEWILSDKERGVIQQALATGGQPSSGEVQGALSLAKNELLSPAEIRTRSNYRAADLIALADTRAPEDWTWTKSPDGLWHADASEAVWRWHLVQDPGFLTLAADVGRLFLIFVPLRWQPGRRRVVKLSFTEYFSVRARKRTGSQGLRAKAGRLLNVLEDRVEVVPTPIAGAEWMPAEQPRSTAGGGRIVRALQAVGLSANKSSLRVQGLSILLRIT